MKLNEIIGLRDEEFTAMVAILSSFPAVEEGIVYGSRAKGNYKPFSDIDLTLIGENISAFDILRIANRLDESSLPYIFDISDFKSLTNINLIDHIKRRGIIVFKRGANHDDIKKDELKLSKLT